MRAWACPDFVLRVLAWLCLAIIPCLVVACISRVHREMIETGPAAFADPAHPAILAAQKAEAEDEALMELMRAPIPPCLVSDPTLSDQP